MCVCMHGGMFVCMYVTCMYVCMNVFQSYLYLCVKM